jgi:hypothetical protein
MVSPLPLLSTRPDNQPKAASFFSLGKMSRSVVCPAVWVFDCVCKLVLYKVRPNILVKAKEKAPDFSRTFGFVDH